MVRSLRRQPALEVMLTFDGKAVSLRVADNGQGLDLERHGTGHGLENMRFRSEEIGGRFTLRSAPGSGTEVEVWLPAVTMGVPHPQIPAVGEGEGVRS